MGGWNGHWHATEESNPIRGFGGRRSSIELVAYGIKIAKGSPSVLDGGWNPFSVLALFDVSPHPRFWSSVILAGNQTLCAYLIYYA